MDLRLRCRCLRGGDLLQRSDPVGELVTLHHRDRKAGNHHGDGNLLYLSQHFLQDILFGGVLGIGVAIIVYFLQNKWSDDAQKWWNKRIEIKA